MLCSCAGDAPSWTYLLSAFAVVFYTILDCLDGKHARRTNTSSPLGQLFDHGCDALSVNLLLANIACSLSIGCSWAHALGNLGVRRSRLQQPRQSDSCRAAE
jgi:ethanolaminephosphotransferase